MAGESNAASEPECPVEAIFYEGNVPEHMADALMRSFDEEMTRYRNVVNDAGNPIGRLRIVTNTKAAAKYLGDRARRKLGDDIDLDVQIRHEGDE